MIPMEMIVDTITKPWCWSLCDFVPVELRRVASSTPFAFPIVQLFTMEDEPSTLNVPKQVYRDGGWALLNMKR